MRKIIFLSFLCLFFSFISFGQQKSFTSITKERKTERALEFRYKVIEDKSNPFVMIDGKSYRWFSGKEKAKQYFETMNMKQDYTIVYIDSNQENLKQPEVITITETPKE